MNCEIYKESNDIIGKDKNRWQDQRKKLKSIVIIVLLFDSQILNIQLLKLQPDKPICLYVRTQVLKGQVHTKIEIVTDVPEIKKLLAEFGKIGSNLNQIAKYFNQGGILSQEMRGEINKRLRDLYEMKYKVMEMAGDFHGNTETHRK